MSSRWLSAADVKLINLKSVALAAALMLLACNAATACAMVPFRFHRGQTVETTMTVSSGKRCGAHVRAGARSRFDNVSITAAPRNGTAVVGASGSVSYRPKPGYRGPDTFVFALTGQLAAGPGTAAVRVNVTVR